jgi:hypothetical protein
MAIAWLLSSVFCLIWGAGILRTQPRGGRLCMACGILNLAAVFLPAIGPVASHK